MKMTQQHYDQLKTLTLESLASHPILLNPEIAKGEYKRLELSATRFYFDCYYLARRYNRRVYNNDFEFELNQYLNDHICTAMKKILGTY